jgi:hypothetical protein
MYAAVCGDNVTFYKVVAEKAVIKISFHLKQLQAPHTTGVKLA